MDSKNILEHEEELRKLNIELEQRTKKWMKDIAAAVNDDTESWISEASREKEIDQLTQSLFIDDSSIVSPVKRKPPRQKILVKSNSRNNLNIVDDTTRGLSSESTIRFLRAKVSLLQNQIITLQHQLTTSTDELNRVETELKQNEDEKLKNSQELFLTREKLRKQEQLTTDLMEKNNLKNKEYNLLKKELELMKRDTKRSMATATAYELKLNRAKEEIDRLKHSLKSSQNGEKEARDGGRARNEELTQSVRKLEKQKAELVSAFKKQLNLIENLKKQKTLVQSSRILQLADDEFLKLLDGTNLDF